MKIKIITPHPEIVEALGFIHPDTPVTLTATFPRKCVWQEAIGTSKWKGHEYTINRCTTYVGATLKTDKCTAGELRNYLSGQWINDWDHVWQVEFDEEIQTVGGESEKHVIWEDSDDEFSRKQLNERLTLGEDYWDAPAEFSWHYEGLKTLNIEIDLGCLGQVKWELKEEDKWNWLEKVKAQEEFLKKQRASKKKVVAKRKSKTLKHS